MERNLSSRLTIFWKFIFPTVWIGFAGILTYAAWFHPERFRDGGSPFERWGTTAMLLFGTTLLVPHSSKLCHIRMNDDGLTMSNYWREAHIPFAAIEDVEYRPRKGPPRVNLTFRSPTPLGRRVAFIPGVGSIEALVTELRWRAGLQQTNPS